ncbi:unnamed protein product, partial [Rhizoctonia solani]
PGSRLPLLEGCLDAPLIDNIVNLSKTLCYMNISSVDKIHRSNPLANIGSGRYFGSHTALRLRAHFLRSNTPINHADCSLDTCAPTIRASWILNEPHNTTTTTTTTTTHSPVSGTRGIDS